VLYAASANRKYVDNIIKVLADVVLRPRITEDEVKIYDLIFFLYIFVKMIQLKIISIIDKCSKFIFWHNYFFLKYWEF